MTIAVFLVSLLGAMAIGIPIAFSLLLCGVALMWHLDMFDAQILAQGRERQASRRVPAGHRPAFWRRNASGLRRSVNPNGTVDP